jgi:hypothetical protein
MSFAAFLLDWALSGITWTDTSAESNDASAAFREQVRLADPRAAAENCGAMAGWLQKFSGVNSSYAFVLSALSDGHAQQL